MASASFREQQYAAEDRAARIRKLQKDGFLKKYWWVPFVAALAFFLGVMTH
jgi:hypothetical protein